MHHPPHQNPVKVRVPGEVPGSGSALRTPPEAPGAGFPPRPNSSATRYRPGQSGSAGVAGSLPVARGVARCELIHADDESGCEGPADAVRLVDAQGEEAYGCVHHAAVALASIDGARVYPGSVEGAAIEAFRRASGLPPFPFHPEVNQ